MKSLSSSPSKMRYLLVPFPVLALLLGVYLATASFIHVWPFLRAVQPQNSTKATSAELQPGIDKQKSAFVDQQNRAKQQSGSSTAQNPDSSGSQLVHATVIVTDAAQYNDTVEVRAYIPDHYENGTCIITFTKDGKTVTKQSPAYTDATTTICTNPLIKKSEFPVTGAWNLVVSYQSKGANGQSSPMSVTVK